MERTMKAIVRDAYGSVDVLRFAEIDRPVADENEVLVRVRAGHSEGSHQGRAGLGAIFRARAHRRANRAGWLAGVYLL